MVALPGFHGETGGQGGAVHFVCSGVQVGSIPGNAAGGRRCILDDRGVERQLDMLRLTHTHTHRGVERQLDILRLTHTHRSGTSTGHAAIDTHTQEWNVNWTFCD